MTALTSLGLFVFAVIAYAIKDLQAHGKLKLMDDKKPFGFWGKASHVRKYRQSGGYRDVAFKTTYYKLIGSPWVEAWPTSTWLTVMFTDGYHLMQFLFKLFLIGSLVSYKEMVNPWIDMLIYLSIWGLCFTIVYKELSK